jgi:hypothetical protein
MLMGRKLCALTVTPCCSAVAVGGGLVIYDDGSIPDLSALLRLRQVNGPLYVYGTNGSAGLTSLEGLQNLEVRSNGLPGQRWHARSA